MTEESAAELYQTYRAAGKLSKESVNYRETASESVRCGTCDMFRPATNTCSLVEGKIEPRHHVCNRWEAK